MAKNADILDRELKLEPLAAMVGVQGHSGIASAADLEVLLRAPDLPFSCGRVIDQSITLDDVHRRTLRRAEVVHHGKGADLWRACLAQK
jgi:hypothetical protein